MAKHNTLSRLLSLIVVFAMLFCIVPTTANDAIAYTVEIGNVSVDMDKTDATDGYYEVSVPVNITKNEGLISITAEVTYDQAIELTGWVEGEIFPGIEDGVSVYNISSALSTDLAKNPYKIMYVASELQSNIKSTGTLMTLNFKVPLSVRSMDYPISVKVTSLITQDDTQETKPASEVSELASVASGKISMKTEGSGVIPVALYKAEDINVGIDKGTNKFPTGSAEVLNVSTKYSYQHLLPGDITKVVDAVRYELKVTNTTLKLSDARYVKIGYRTNSTNNTPQVGVWINNGSKDIRVYDKAFATFEKNDLWGETVYDLQQNYTGSSDSSIVLSGDASADWTSLKDNFFKGVCLRAYGATNSTIAEGSYFDIAYIALFNSADEAAKYTYFKSANVEFKDGDTILATKNLVVGDRLVYPEEPEVAGKVFAGWDTQEGTLLLGDTVVNAIFKEDAKVNVKINTQNGTFTVNDGEAISSYDEAVGAGETLELIAMPATGYKFDGWYDVTGENDELITEESEYSLFVKATCELEARFVDVNAPEEPVAIFDLYANKDTKKHVVNYNKFSTNGYSQEDNAFKFTGKGSHNEKDMGFSPDNVDFSDAGNAARKALIDSEAEISYMVVTYRNPQGMASIKRRYIDNSNKDIKEDIALKNSGDEYYSVIIDVSGQRLWFRNYHDQANVSNIAFYPFSSLDSTDTNSYDLYFRSIALTRDLKDAYGYCKSLITAGDSAAYHLNGGDLITDEVEKEEFDLKISAQNGTFTVNGGEATALVEGKYEKDSKFTLVATAAENYEFIGWYDVTGENDELITEEATYELTVSAALEIEARFESTVVIPIALYEAEDINVSIDKSKADRFLNGTSEILKATDKYSYQHLLPGDTPTTFDAVRYELKVTNTTLKVSDVRYVKIGYRTNSNNNNPQVGLWINNGSKDIRVYDKAFATFELNDLWGETVYDLKQDYSGSSDSSIDLTGDVAADWASLGDELFKGVCLRAYGPKNLTINPGSYFDVAYIALFNSADDAAEYTYFEPTSVTFNAGGESFEQIDVVLGDKLVYPEATPEAPEGKVFAGWDVEEGTVITGETTVNAVFEDEVEPVKVKVTATENGTFTVGEETGITVYNEDIKPETILTLTAEADPGYKLEGWYEITSGKNKLLTRETTYVHTVSEAIDIEARFMDETISIAVKLVASTSEGGLISVNGNVAEDVNDYVNGSSTTELTAVAEEGYVFAYWKRVSCQSGTEIFMSTDATLSAAPLGNTVYYVPVFVAEGTTLNLYLDSQELILGTEEPEIPSRLGYTASEWKLVDDGDVVDTYKPVYTRAEADTVLTIVYADSTTEEVAFKYDDKIDVVGTLENPVWTLTANGEETIVSYDKEFSFGAAFTSNITLTESENTNGTNAIVSGVEAVYDSGASLIKFVAMFTLPEGATLNERGVLLTNDASIAADMELNTPNIIVGRVNSDPDTATKTFIINKTMVNAGDTWYGRAYIVYTENGETKTLYATTMEGKAE